MYLIFEGVEFCEEFELAVREHKPDLRAHIRRLHLLVTAMHEFIETLKTYSLSTHFAKEFQEPIQKVMEAVGIKKNKISLRFKQKKRFLDNEVS